MPGPANKYEGTVFPAGMRQRGKTAIQARFSFQGKRHERTFSSGRTLQDNLKTAMRWQAAQKEELKLRSSRYHGSVKFCGMTLESGLRLLDLHYRAEKKNSYQGYIAFLLQNPEQFPLLRIPLEDLQRSDITKFRKDMQAPYAVPAGQAFLRGRARVKGKRPLREKTRSRATVNKYINLLSVVIDHLNEEHDADFENVVKTVRKLKGADRKRKHRVTDDEFAAILSHIPAQDASDIVEFFTFSLNQGTRRQETFNLTWGDVDPANYRLTLPHPKADCKTKSLRVVVEGLLPSHQLLRPTLNQTSHSSLVSFIWRIADDCLRDVYVRGKYRDVILPMVVLRRLDTLLEPTKDAVLEEVRYQKEDIGATELDDEPLKDASGYVFFNTSHWTLKKLYNTATNNQQILLANIEDYLEGFSENVKEIIDRFKLFGQMRHMAEKQVLLDVIEKFVSPWINLTPNEMEDPEGNTLPGLSNLGMGYVFEELIRKFNEENNEEAGEHFTPREVIHLMTHLLFDPIKGRLPQILTIYDPACGSGGMLTEAQNYITDADGPFHAQGDVYLYGKEINDETYAICKSDMMIKGNNPENIRVGSTLSTDEFSANRFDFMLSNPPYGKSWKSEVKYIKDGKDVIDPRFKVELADYWGKVETMDATPRLPDGQLLFLMEMISKMKPTSASPLGSRIASVHNGSSLFTGDAGNGESNIRRFIIENDMLDTIIQLPNNLFYNTGITTYIWLLSNAKPEARRGRVQLIDASLMFRKLRKNLGDKNCEFSDEHIQQITEAFLNFASVERQIDAAGDPQGIAVQVFDNADFGYYKVIIERPDRRRAGFSAERLAPLRFDKSLREPMEWLYDEHGDQVYQPGFLKEKAKQITAWCEEAGLTLNAKAKAKAKLLDTKYWVKLRDLLATATQIMGDVGFEETDDFNAFRKAVNAAIKARKIKLAVTEKNAILNAVSWYDETAQKVIDKKHKLTGAEVEELTTHLGCAAEDLADFGWYRQKDGSYLTYESTAELRDAESVALKDNIHRYFLAEVKPHVEEAWINLDSVKIGYEISFNKYFYRHKPLRSLEEVTQDILALEEKADGLIADILGVEVATKLEPAE